VSPGAPAAKRFLAFYRRQVAFPGISEAFGDSDHASAAINSGKMSK